MRTWRIKAWNPNTGKEAPEFTAKISGGDWMNSIKNEISRRHPGMVWLEAHRL